MKWFAFGFVLGAYLSYVLAERTAQNEWETL